MRVSLSSWPDNATNEHHLLAILQECLQALNGAREECEKMFEASQGHCPGLSYFVPGRLPRLLKAASELNTRAETQLKDDLQQFADGQASKSAVEACFNRLTKDLVEQMCKVCDELRPYLIALAAAVSQYMDDVTAAQDNDLEDLESSLLSATEALRDRWSLCFPGQEIVDLVAI